MFPFLWIFRFKWKCINLHAPTEDLTSCIITHPCGKFNRIARGTNGGFHIFKTIFGGVLMLLISYFMLTKHIGMWIVNHQVMFIQICCLFCEYFDLNENVLICTSPWRASLYIYSVTGCKVLIYRYPVVNCDLIGQMIVMMHISRLLVGSHPHPPALKIRYKQRFIRINDMMSAVTYQYVVYIEYIFCSRSFCFC